MQDRKAVICIVAAAAIIYSLSSLVSARRSLELMTQRENELRLEYRALSRVNSGLSHDIEYADSSDTVEMLARQRLRLVYPQDTVFYFSDR